MPGKYWIHCFLLFISVATVKGQTPTTATSTPSWLPKERVKTDTSQAKPKTGIAALISGFDSAIGGSVPGVGPQSKSISSLFNETIPDLGLRATAYKNQKAEKKRKKALAKLAKVEYEGIPMQAISVKHGSGDRATVEMFHVLKEYKPMNPYVRIANIRWYDTKVKRLSSSIIKNKERSLLLHGPYKKFSGENLIEEGYYYMGTRHGRWVKYDTKYNLIDKSIWDKGFPAESHIAYYDSAHTQIKEVVPIMFGTTEGEYLQFYKEGQLKAIGKYDHGEKVGRWIEYYQFRRQRKQEIQYPKTAWDEDFEPFIIREWDDKGKLTYDSSTDPRASADVEEEEN
ncbi:hypothetical protein CLV98_12114 [Dyadobacter jejuensis]|uniref:Antitoxin component YwqK of YwqJK toxin-antitoxin module n=1 Tax=Dyadobacter jejuensis TaxID=1082580 RepID=A0A316A8C0_9BACT|nr:hypothetical protein [Dyadobacter jejuensis]PWJ53742.1 hypothetical protein CLV98_12114 [Dyadobacter jejuensis]